MLPGLKYFSRPSSHHVPTQGGTSPPFPTLLAPEPHLVNKTRCALHMELVQVAAVVLNGARGLRSSAVQA